MTLKGNFQDNILQYPLKVIPPKLLHFYSKDLGKQLQMYLHHASELLSKIRYTTDMAQIPVEGLNHYAIVYGLNSTKLKDK